MRIVFEFYGGDPQVAFTGRALDSDHRQPPRWEGAQVEGIIIDTPVTHADPKDLHYGDDLHVEGRLRTLRLVFKRGLEQLDDLEKDLQREVEERIARSKQCEACSMWFDTKVGAHGDGRGMTCLGDGTAILGQRAVIINHPSGMTIGSQVGDLRAGDRFIIAEPMAEYEMQEFEALEDACVREGYAGVRIKRHP